MNKQEIIEQLSRDCEIKNICKKFTAPHLVNDLYQELFLILLEYPEEKLISVYKKGMIRFFIVRCLMNTTTPIYGKFHKKFMWDNTKNAKDYLRDLEINANDTSIDISACRLNKIIKKHENSSDDNWYATQLFRLYLQEGSIRKLTKITNIPHVSIFVTLKNFKQKIKKEYENSIDNRN